MTAARRGEPTADGLQLTASAGRGKPIADWRRGEADKVVSVVKRNLTTESRRLVHEPWTSAELGILRRFARAVIAGRYSTAAAAVPRCQAALAGRHTKHSITARLHRCLHELGQPVLNLRWSPEEKAVVDRFARAVVRGEYPNVGEALPNCQRERRRVAPTIERTDVAVAWELLCRAYGHGLARRKHLWTDDELPVAQAPRESPGGREVR